MAAQHASSLDRREGRRFCDGLVPAGAIWAGRPGTDPQLDVVRRGTCLQLSARGELDLSSVDALEEALADAWPTLNGVILIDLTACSFIDSSIVTLLLRWHERAHGARTSLVVLATGAVMATLELTGVRERLTVVDDGRAQRAAAGAGSAGGLA